MVKYGLGYTFWLSMVLGHIFWVSMAPGQKVWLSMSRTHILYTYSYNIESNFYEQLKLYKSYVLLIFTMEIVKIICD